MCLMLCLYIHVRVFTHVIVLMFTIISCCLSLTPSPLYTINNEILMCKSPIRLIGCYVIFYPKNKGYDLFYWLISIHKFSLVSCFQGSRKHEIFFIQNIYI